MNKLAILFPSRYRPELLERALRSLEENCVQSDIYFGFQKDDPSINDNMRVTKNYPHIILDDIGLALKTNRICEFARLHYDYDAYMIFNDDQIARTYSWDKILLNRLDILEKMSGHRLWILHWKDGIHNERLPQSFATKELLEIIGTYNPEGYMRHLFIDNVYKFIGEGCGILHYIEEVFIEHLHCSIKRTSDKCSRETQKGHGGHRKEEENYKRWIKEKGNNLVLKIQTELSRIDGL